MNKNKKTGLNMVYQRVLVITSLFCFAYGIYYAVYNNDWATLIISFLLGKFIVSLFATQICLHRYFAHKSFVTSRNKHKLLCYLSIFAGQGSPVGWAAHHRHHHAYADTNLDTHSPKESFLLAAGLWLLKSYDFYLYEKKLKRVPTDLLRDPTIKFIDNYYYHIWLSIIVLSFMIHWKITVFFLLSPLMWGYINAACITLGSHIRLPGSYRNFETMDNSYNNKFIQLYMLGEGLHNNHHHAPNRYNESMYKNEFDPAGVIIHKFFRIPNNV